MSTPRTVTLTCYPSSGRIDVEGELFAADVVTVNLVTGEGEAAWDAGKVYRLTMKWAGAFADAALVSHSSWTLADGVLSAQVNLNPAGILDQMPRRSRRVMLGVKDTTNTTYGHATVELLRPTWSPADTPPQNPSLNTMTDAAVTAAIAAAVAGVESAGGTTKVANSSVSGGRAVRLRSDGQMEHADGSNLAHAHTVFGVSSGAVAPAASGTVVTDGGEVTGLSGLTPEQPVYVGADGVLGHTPGTAFTLRAGFAITASSVRVSIQQPILT